MAFNLSVSTITPPDGLQHTDRKTEIMELPSYLRVTGASGSAKLKLIVVGPDKPGEANTDNVWLKTDEVGTAHGFYLYDTTEGVWLLMGGPGVESGTTAPTDLNVLWLKTDTATTARGLYKYESGAWVNMTATPAGAASIITAATAPADATIPYWLKTTDATTPRGLHYWSGGWVNGTLSPAATAVVNGTTLATGSGVGANYIYTNANQPPAAIRNFVLWAKTGNPIQGLFWPDAANSRWESINPILFSYRYPDVGTQTMPSPYLWNPAGLTYDVLCPGLGTAVFAAIPSMTVVVENDDRFETAGAYLNIAAYPSLSTWSIGIYNPTGVGERKMALRMSVVGIMRIPFV